MGDETSWSRLRSEVYALIGRNPKSNRLVPSIADLEPSHTVLDIGCGPGAAVRAAVPLVAHAVGVDRSDAMVAIARRRSRHLTNVEFAVAGAEQLPFPDATFDRIWTIHAFHHWENQSQGLTESLRLLRPSGRLLIVETDTNRHHGMNRAAANALATELRELGFADAAASKPSKYLVVTGVAAS